MRYLRSYNSLYFVAGPVLHKSLEIGYNRRYTGDGGFDVYWRFRTRGDHAGLTFFVQLGTWLFEFNVHDDRHWNWEKKRWFTDGEYPEFEGYPHE